MCLDYIINEMPAYKSSQEVITGYKQFKFFKRENGTVKLNYLFYSSEPVHYINRLYEVPIASLLPGFRHYPAGFHIWTDEPPKTGVDILTLKVHFYPTQILTIGEQGGQKVYVTSGYWIDNEDIKKHNIRFD